MYIHIGEKKTLLGENIIGVFDIEKTTVTIPTRQFLDNAERSGQVITCEEGFIPRSFTIFDKADEKKVYLSIVSPLTVGIRGQ